MQLQCHLVNPQTLRKRNNKLLMYSFNNLINVIIIRTLYLHGNILFEVYCSPCKDSMRHFIPLLLSTLTFLTCLCCIAGRLQVCCSNAPYLLLGSVYVDAAGRGAAVPHGGAGVQCHHSAPILIHRWLWDTPCYRHHIGHR